MFAGFPNQSPSTNYDPPQTPIYAFLHRSHYEAVFPNKCPEYCHVSKPVADIEHSSQTTDFQNFTLLVFEARIAKIQDG